MIWGVVEKGYCIPEIATQFLTMGIVPGLIGVAFSLNNMTVNDIAVGSIVVVGAVLMGLNQAADTQKARK